MDSLTITRPDDWHIHLRDGDALRDTVADVSRYFGRAIIMPNLVPPVADVASASNYRNRIMSLVPENTDFTPLMTLYLTDTTTPATVLQARESGFVHAFKLYPAGATTNSDAGVKAINSLFPVFEAMQTQGMPLAVHGEVTNHEVDVFDREAFFIEEYLEPIHQRFPQLKIIFEHITTADAVEYVQQSDHHIAATITVHHLMFNRTDMLAGGIKPLYYCLPILKRDIHQKALIRAATSGDPAFFLGTDSAPHPRSAKENACGCAAGCYTAHAAIELYAEVFEQADALPRLEAFSSHFGPDFYGLPRNEDKIVLNKKTWEVPETQKFGSESLIPLRGGDTISWQVES